MIVKGKTLKKALASLLAVFFLLPLAAFAQTETGQITVKAVDPQKAVVAGASVTVKSVERGTTQTATTSDEGIATITNLQPGLYEVTVTGSGFAPTTQRAQVTVGAKLTLDFDLSAQAKGEVVNVVAGEGGVEVNTQTQELSDVVSQKQITELPTLTRNPYDLVGISGNVSPADPSGRGTGFAINGQRAASTNILLDGGENVDTFVAGVGQNVPLDSVQEFRIITSNFSAEYGRASGGIVNVATRAGSNAFHGSLYEFNRISALASNDFENNAQGIPKGTFTRNQFGYSAGGRVIKDKLFFFSSTEWTRIRSSQEVVSLVPTPEFLAQTSATTRAYFSNYQLVTPINGPTFTAGQLGVAGVPSGLPVLGQVRSSRAVDAGGGTPGNDWQTVGRFDYNWSDRTQVYFRGAFQQGDNPLGTVSFSPYQGFNTGFEYRNQNYLTSVTHSFSSNLVSQTKFVYNRLNQDQGLGEQPPQPTLFFFGSGAANFGGFLVRLPGYLPTSPGSAIPFGGPQNFYQAYEDLNWTRGNHTWRFGGQYVHIRDNRTFGAYEEAVQVLGTTAGNAFANLINGRLVSFTVAIDPQGKFPCHRDITTGATIVTPDCTIQTPVGPPAFSRSNRYHEWAAYANDSWKVKQRLTLNLGVRYEYYGVQHNADPSLDSNFYLGDGANIFERIRNGQIMRAKDSPVGALWKPDKNNFAPRLGIAWDIFGDGSTSLRGGYGMAYERNFGNVTFNVIQNPPNYATVQLTPSVVPGGVLPISSNNYGVLAGSGIARPLPATSLRGVDPDIVNAYAHFWSAAFERHLAKGTVASVEYSGSAGRSLYSISNINRRGTGNVYLGDTLTTSGFGSGRLNNNGASDINFRTNGGRSNYNAMIVSFDSTSLAKLNLRLTARYTYAVTKDNLSSTFSDSSNNFNLGFLDPFNPDLDYGYADFDVRHRFVTSFTWDIPSIKSLSGWADRLVNGWQFSGIYVARTGSPFTVFDCANSIFAESPCMRVIANGPLNFDPHISRDNATPLDQPNRYAFVNLTGLTPGTFVNPITGGNDPGPYPDNMTKRNAFRGPGLWNLDAAAYKNFRFTENTRLQLRLEAYNVFNHANAFVIYGFPANEVAFNSDGFVPAFYSGRRNVQLAAKFIF
ncbi:MAG TPA: TonB-dependent receptor [Blastocatellia bacterium]|nr:TonB-dependent receptor [Blastocatellia bacterium]